MTVSKTTAYAPPDPDDALILSPADVAAIARRITDYRRGVAKGDAERLLASHAAQAERIASLERAELHCENLHDKIDALIAERDAHARELDALRVALVGVEEG